MTQRSPFRDVKTSPEIIRQAAKMDILFSLSLHKVANLPRERGIEASHETVRFRWHRFGPLFASEIRERRRIEGPRPCHGRWPLDEGLVNMNGARQCLWRARLHFRRMRTAQKVRRRPCLGPQPFRPGTRPRLPRPLQADPGRRLRRMARPLRGT